MFQIKYHTEFKERREFLDENKSLRIATVLVWNSRGKWHRTEIVGADPCMVSNSTFLAIYPPESLYPTNLTIFRLFDPFHSNFRAVPPVFVFPRKLPSRFSWKHTSRGLVLHYSLSPPYVHLPFGSDLVWHHKTRPCDGRICPEISVDLVRQNHAMQEFSHLPWGWCHVIMGFAP